jgi:integrase
MKPKTVTRPLPAGSKLLGNGKARLPSGKIVAVNDNGRMVTKTKTLYARIGGKTISLTDDRQSALEFESKLRLDKQRVARGLDPSLPVPGTVEAPLSGFVIQWLDELRGAGRNDGHIRTLQARIGILKKAGTGTIGELSRQSASQAIATALKALSDDGEKIKLPKGTEFTPRQLFHLMGISQAALSKIAIGRGINGQGKGKAKVFTRAEAEILVSQRGRGASPATVNGYRVAISSFCNWLKRRGLLERVPHLPMRQAEKQRRPRRSITWEECQHLAAITAKRGKVRGGMTPKARSVLYRVAFTTLLRARALRELRVGDCHLTGDHPWLSVRGETDKNGIARRIPIDHLGEEIALLVKGKRDQELVWGLPDGMAAVLREDLRLAGIPFQTDDGVCDFHSLRHSGCTHLIRKGISPLIVAQLGGWTDLKMILRRYSHLAPSDLEAALRGVW